MSDAARQDARSTPVARLVLLAGVFLLPMELPFTEAMHFALWRFLGDWYLLAHPFTLLAVGALISGVWSPRRMDTVLLAAGIGFLASTVVLHGNLEWAVRYIWFGVLSVTLMAKCAEDGELVRAFLYGLGTWAVIGLGFYAFYFAGDAGHYSSAAAKIMALRSPGAEIANSSPFFQYLGNMNKAANYAVLGLILALYCEISELIERRAVAVIYAALAGILIVTFSRGALAVCGLAAVALFVLSFRVKGARRASMRWPAIAFAVPLLISLSTPAYQAYWRNLDTVQTRLLMAQAAVTDRSAPKRADLGNMNAGPDVVRGNVLLGYGVGNYGMQNFKDPVRGTHNLFIDIWTDGGILALGAFVFYVLCSLWGLRRHLLGADPRPFIVAGAIASVVVLGFREYDLAYLYATSLGGALVGLFVGLAERTEDGRMQVDGPRLDVTGMARRAARPLFLTAAVLLLTCQLAWISWVMATGYDDLSPSAKMAATQKLESTLRSLVASPFKGG